MIGRMGEQIHATEVGTDTKVVDFDGPRPALSLQLMLQQALDEVKVPESSYSSCASGINFSSSLLMAKVIRI